MFSIKAGLILNCGYARTAIFQLYGQTLCGRLRKASKQNGQQTCIPKHRQADKTLYFA